MNGNLRGLDLEAIVNQTVDLKQIPIDAVFEELKCSKEGLSSKEGANRLKTFGPNKESKVLKCLGMHNPHAWIVMEWAAVMAITNLYWQDFVGIIVLLTINLTISFIEENIVGNAAASLMARMTLKTKVLRDRVWSERDASILVPGDIIKVRMGDIVPADVRLLEGDPLQIDQSTLTGESIPMTKYPGDEVFSGSTCNYGEIEVVVIATGVHTFFGKADHFVDNTNQIGCFQKVLFAISNFCAASIAIAIFIEMIVMCGIQRREYKDVIDNLLVLLIGGMPIAMPTVLSMTLVVGSQKLAKQGAIAKRMIVIEKMAGMDVLCSDKTGTLTLNKLSVDKNLIEIFMKGVSKDHLLLLAARASRLENQDAIDTAMVGMLADPKEARANIQEVHFNLVDKRTALTYIDDKGNWHRVSKGAPDQIMNLCKCKEDVKHNVHSVICKYVERGFVLLAVAQQEVPEKSMKSPGGPWQFVGVLPLFDPPRQDSVDTIQKALNLGVNVKMITGDQLAIGKEIGRRLGMGTNMYPYSALFGHTQDLSFSFISIDDLIQQANGFSGVCPENKYEIVKKLQQKKHICGMTGDGVNDAPALKKADIGIAVADATDAARNASDIVLTEPGLSVIISAILTSRSVFQRMKNYMIYALTITIRVVLGFMIIALRWKFDFSPFMVLIIAIVNDGTIIAISKDWVKASPFPDSWKLKEIFSVGVSLGCYLVLMKVIFFWAMYDTNYFPDTFHVRSIRDHPNEMRSALYLQVSIISQALIFVTRSHTWFFFERRPGYLLVTSFIISQSAATLIAVYAKWGFARIMGIGWHWAGVVWLYSIFAFLPLDLIKFATHYILSTNAWNNLLDRKIAFTSKNDYGLRGREIRWDLELDENFCRHDLHHMDTESFYIGSGKPSEMVRKAEWRAELERYKNVYTNTQLDMLNRC